MVSAGHAVFQHTTWSIWLPMSLFCGRLMIFWSRTSEVDVAQCFIWRSSSWILSVMQVSPVMGIFVSQWWIPSISITMIIETVGRSASVIIRRAAPRRRWPSHSHVFIVAVIRWCRSVMFWRKRSPSGGRWYVPRSWRLPHISRIEDWRRMKSIWVWRSSAVEWWHESGARSISKKKRWWRHGWFWGQNTVRWEAGVANVADFVANGRRSGVRKRPAFWGHVVQFRLQLYDSEHINTGVIAIQLSSHGASSMCLQCSAFLKAEKVQG